MDAWMQQLGQYADCITPLTFDYLNSHVVTLSSQLGVAEDQLRYVLSLFAMYPLALLYSFIPHSSAKHLFSILVGISTAQFVFGSSWVHSLITATITYFLVRFGPAKYAPYIVFVFNMMYMTLAHLYRIYVDYMGWSLDFSGAQMLIVIKLPFAYNYYDGLVDKVHVPNSPSRSTTLGANTPSTGCRLCWSISDTSTASPCFWPGLPLKSRSICWSAPQGERHSDANGLHW